MPPAVFSVSEALQLGRFVLAAYDLFASGDPAAFAPPESYSLVSKIYADDITDGVPDFKVFGFVARSGADVVVAIREDAQITGYLWVQRVHGDLYFSTAVFPEFQRRGFGSEARWRTEQILAEQGVQTLFAQVNTNSHETGRPSRRSLLRGGYSFVPDETFGLAPDADERIVLGHPAPIQFRKNLGLTPAEHRRAQELAYQYAIERGGGIIPPYDLARVVEDFCRAAGEIIRQRRRPARAGT